MRSRRGVTGIETAIILVAFVITASAFSFVILNVGFIVSDKAQTTVISTLKETSSSLMADPSITGYFSNTTTGDQSEVCLEEIVFYIKLAQGHEPIDCSDNNMMITYTLARGHTVIYSTGIPNGTVTTIKTITGDSDSLLEVGEKMQVVVDFKQIKLADIKPQIVSHPDKYGKPFEEIRIEIRPTVGSILSIEREIPSVTTVVQTLL
ncbi:MAG: hypothetical protein NWE89_06730 [Candidatus Bathyarchaeota archaeon]|nr:hypothetical protein [Candidatus Bathyarchaeota archaeon]